MDIKSSIACLLYEAIYPLLSSLLVFLQRQYRFLPINITYIILHLLFYSNSGWLHLDNFFCFSSYLLLYNLKNIFKSFLFFHTSLNFYFMLLFFSNICFLSVTVLFIPSTSFPCYLAAFKSIIFLFHFPLPFLLTLFLFVILFLALIISFCISLSSKPISFTLPLLCFFHSSIFALCHYLFLFFSFSFLNYFFTFIILSSMILFLLSIIIFSFCFLYFLLSFSIFFYMHLYNIFCLLPPVLISISLSLSTSSISNLFCFQYFTFFKLKFFSFFIQFLKFSANFPSFLCNFTISLFIFYCPWFLIFFITFSFSPIYVFKLMKMDIFSFLWERDHSLIHFSSIFGKMKNMTSFIKLLQITAKL